jgi:hypothetical protein
LLQIRKAHIAVMVAAAFLTIGPLVRRRSSAQLGRRSIYACAVPSSPVPSVASSGSTVTTAPQLRVVSIPHVWDYAGGMDGATRPSPLQRAAHHFVDGDLVLAQTVVHAVISAESEKAEAADGIDCLPWDTEAYLRAGPRRNVYFGEDTRVAIVTCGGIAPGLNTILRELVMCLFHDYGGETNFLLVFGGQRPSVASVRAPCTFLLIRCDSLHLCTVGSERDFWHRVRLSWLLLKRYSALRTCSTEV